MVDMEEPGRAQGPSQEAGDDSRLALLLWGAAFWREVWRGRPHVASLPPALRKPIQSGWAPWTGMAPGTP
ncbi:hypothetical protein CT3_23970 [Comamonas terrigena NBRC 13299]|nr:hypothetical protein CT3_23970 [Comamonas terrigena NBRC 13299]